MRLKRSCKSKSKAGTAERASFRSGVRFADQAFDRPQMLEPFLAGRRDLLDELFGTRAGEQRLACCVRSGEQIKGGDFSLEFVGAIEELKRLRRLPAREREQREIGHDRAE